MTQPRRRARTAWAASARRSASSDNALPYSRQTSQVSSVGLALRCQADVSWPDQLAIPFAGSGTLGSRSGELDRHRQTTVKSATQDSASDRINGDAANMVGLGSLSSLEPKLEEETVRSSLGNGGHKLENVPEIMYILSEQNGAFAHDYDEFDAQHDDRRDVPRVVPFQNGHVRHSTSKSSQERQSTSFCAGDARAAAADNGNFAVCNDDIHPHVPTMLRRR
eukprot:891339-Rhodomonas_salina.2